ncbi:MAG: hypothetical protein IJ496_06035 [Ruminococcus sp.]|nr:hypothetical protein [Ruminococcus sp.]
MNISANVKYILEKTTEWRFYTNRSYPAKIQKADVSRVYNAEGQPGVVYNFLEDAYEKVTEGGYIITGVAGEMWPVGPGVLKKYDVDPEKITFEPQCVRTIEVDTVYAGIRIPSDIQFTLEADYGERALLKGNRPGLSHGEGDYILVAAKLENGKLVPDLSDSGRIVNGTIFDQLYKTI